jgi:hypothetical protein
MGLLFGLLGGAVAAAVKMVQGRTGGAPAPVEPAPWTPIPNAEPVVVPPKPAAPAPAGRSAQRDVSIADLQEAPAPAPAKKAAAPRKKKVEPWVEPVDGECPPTHPVKAKLSSKIYHLPGGFNYARTRPDRCYVSAAAAEADGLRPSKR